MPPPPTHFHSSYTPQTQPPVLCFWDIENCSAPRDRPITHTVKRLIRFLCERYGRVHSISAYCCVDDLRHESRTELQLAGVHLVDVSSKRKDAVDKMMIADICLAAADTAVPAVITIISGDQDFAYTMSRVQQRSHHVVAITPLHATHSRISEVASNVHCFHRDILGIQTPISSLPSPQKQQHQQIYHHHQQQQQQQYRPFSSQYTTTFPHAFSQHEQAQHQSSQSLHQQQNRQQQQYKKYNTNLIPKFDNNNNNNIDLSYSPTSSTNTYNKPNSKKSKSTSNNINKTNNTKNKNNSNNKSNQLPQQYNNAFQPLIRILQNAPQYTMRPAAIGESLSQSLPQWKDIFGIRKLKQLLQRAEESGVVYVGEYSSDTTNPTVTLKPQHRLSSHVTNEAYHHISNNDSNKQNPSMRTHAYPNKHTDTVGQAPSPPRFSPSTDVSQAERTKRRSDDVIINIDIEKGEQDLLEVLEYMRQEAIEPHYDSLVKMLRQRGTVRSGKGILKRVQELVNEAQKDGLVEVREKDPITGGAGPVCSPFNPASDKEDQGNKKGGSSNGDRRRGQDILVFPARKLFPFFSYNSMLPAAVYSPEHHIGLVRFLRRVSVTRYVQAAITSPAQEVWRRWDTLRFRGLNDLGDRLREENMFRQWPLGKVYAVVHHLRRWRVCIYMSGGLWVVNEGPSGDNEGNKSDVIDWNDGYGSEQGNTHETEAAWKKFLRNPTKEELMMLKDNTTIKDNVKEAIARANEWVMGGGDGLTDDEDDQEHNITKSGSIGQQHTSFEMTGEQLSLSPIENSGINAARDADGFRHSYENENNDNRDIDDMFNHSIDEGEDAYSQEEDENESEEEDNENEEEEEENNDNNADNNDEDDEEDDDNDDDLVDVSDIDLSRQSSTFDIDAYMSLQNRTGEQQKLLQLMGIEDRQEEDSETRNEDILDQDNNQEYDKNTVDKDDEDNNYEENDDDDDNDNDNDENEDNEDEMENNIDPESQFHFNENFVPKTAPPAGMMMFFNPEQSNDGRKVHAYHEWAKKYDLEKW